MKPIFKLSEETRKLLRYFEEIPFNSPVSFDEAKVALGFDYRNCLPSYYSAKKIAEREPGIVIESIRTFGFLKLPGFLIPDVGARDMKRIHRQADRGARRQEIALTSSNLTREQFSFSSELFARFKIISNTSKPITNRPKPTVPEITYEKDSTENLKKI
jgi:hypothetical protein